MCVQGNLIHSSCQEKNKRWLWRQNTRHHGRFGQQFTQCHILIWEYVFTSIPSLHMQQLMFIYLSEMSRACWFSETSSVGLASVVGLCADFRHGVGGNTSHFQLIFSLTVLYIYLHKPWSFMGRRIHCDIVWWAGWCWTLAMTSKLIGNERIQFQRALPPS